MICDILDFGATANTGICCTGQIQAAIDTCHTSGGGRVVIPPGDYVSGTLELKSGVFLYLEAGSVLHASSDRKDYRRIFPDHPAIEPGAHDYPFNMDEYFIYSRNAEKIGICGHGTIHAEGGNFYHYDQFRECIKQKDGGKEFILKNWRPGPTVCFIESDDITVQDITIKEHPMFAAALLHCRKALLKGLRIRTDKRFINGDGIHLKSSREVMISDCLIDVEDDAVCFYTDMWERGEPRAGNMDYSTSDITVSNCIFSTSCSAIRIGFMGNAPIRNILFHNIIVKSAEAVLDVICCGGKSYLSGNKNYNGPLIENIHLSNVLADNVKWGITMNTDHQTSGNAGIRNFLFDGVRIHSSYGNYLSGTEERPVSNITFRDCDIHVAGGEVTRADPPEELPIFKNTTFACGFLLRNTAAVKFYNTQLEICKGWTSFLEENTENTDLSGFSGS